MTLSSWLVRDIKIAIEDLLPGNEQIQLHQEASRCLCIPPHAIHSLKVVRESIDARKKNRIAVVYTLLVETMAKFVAHDNVSAHLSQPASETDGLIRLHQDCKIPFLNQKKCSTRPIVIGTGPCGLFCALLLVKAGLRPILLERGQPVEQRAADVKAYWQGQTLNTESNVQFGEGGAGAFSDGKLTTRIHDPRCDDVLAALVAFGAPAEILYKAKPHIGTDVLQTILVKIRETLLAQGASIHYGTCVKQIVLSEGQVKGVLLADGSLLDAELVVAAIGHSARDTFESLFASGVQMQAKPFSVGVRIEHLQEDIHRARYGSLVHEKLGAAEYQLFERFADRTAYTFCMCPGGVVVGAASEKETVVTNGMSNHARGGRNANSAFVVSVDTQDTGSHPLDGVQYQRRLEQAAYRLGNSEGAAPVQTLGDFMTGKKTVQLGNIKPSYTGAVALTRLDTALPPEIVARMRAAVPLFDQKMRGFAATDAVLTGFETRTSSPVRILRDDSGEANGIQGLFPAGEGAGYAGGIMSAAVDGLKTAERILALYRWE